MDTKAFEVLIHSQYAFDACRQQVNEYEDCRQTSDPNPKDPQLCRGYANQLLGCYREAERMNPLCLSPFNDARECLFKGDGNLFNCREFTNQYVYCQRDQEGYRDFLQSSTAKQLRPLQFEFVKYRGHFDRQSS